MNSSRDRIRRRVYAKIVCAVAELSTCPRREAGALAVGLHSRVVGIGYNGVPKGKAWPHCTVIPCPGVKDPPGDTTNCYAIHAEANLLLNCGNVDEVQEVYLTSSPCKTCALQLVNLPNLQRVGWIEEYADKRGIDILERSGILTVVLKKEE